jgi:hypothetical protein
VRGRESDEVATQFDQAQEELKQYRNQASGLEEALVDSKGKMRAYAEVWYVWYVYYVYYVYTVLVHCTHTAGGH